MEGLTNANDGHNTARRFYTLRKCDDCRSLSVKINAAMDFESFA